MNTQLESAFLEILFLEKTEMFECQLASQVSIRPEDQVVEN